MKNYSTHDWNGIFHTIFFIWVLHTVVVQKNIVFKIDFVTIRTGLLSDMKVRIDSYFIWDEIFRNQWSSWASPEVDID